MTKRRWWITGMTVAALIILTIGGLAYGLNQRQKANAFVGEPAASTTAAATTTTVSPTPVKTSAGATANTTARPSPTPATKPAAIYLPPVCVTTPIPYQTTYVDVSYLNVGQTQSFGGVDGYTKHCTADSNGWTPEDITLPAYNKTIYVGTYTPPVTPTYTAPKNYSACNQFEDSSAYQECIQAINDQ